MRLIGGILCIVMMGSVGCRRAPVDRLSEGIDVTHYDLAFRLDPEGQLLDARVRLHVLHADSITVLPLDFEGLAVDTVRVDGAVVDAQRRGENLLVPLPPGRTAQVEVVYGGRPQYGLHQARYGGQRVIYTDSWPDNGRGWLPGVHHPSDPATLALDMTVPRGYEAVASGSLVSLDTLGQDVRYRWQLTVPAPIYTFAFAVADFSVSEVVVADTLPVRYYMLAEDAALADRLQRTPQAMVFFEDLVGPYPYAAYASVQVPMRFAGMENASAAFLQADLFRTDVVEEVQVHELAHQWFGNRVPIADWSDLWLSEGTTTYLTTLFYEHVDGRDAVRQRWVTLSRLSAARRATHAALVPREPLAPEAYLTWVPYDKGAVVWHLLRLKLGDAVFNNVLRTLYEHYAGRPLSTAAFQQVLEHASGTEQDTFFAYWVYGDQLPTLQTTWNQTTRTLAWEIIDDDETLRGVPFELRIQQGNRVRYVTVTDGDAVLSEAEHPDVTPVGVLIIVE